MKTPHWLFNSSIYTLCSMLFLLSASTSLLAQNQNITITFKQLSNKKGQIVIDVFNSEKGFPLKNEKAVYQHKVNIGSGITKTTLQLPKGEYAIAAYNDANMNNELDNNFIGMPTEGVCASNNAKGKLGPPKYADARFNVKNAAITMELYMLYF